MLSDVVPISPGPATKTLRKSRKRMQGENSFTPNGKEVQAAKGTEVHLGRHTTHIQAAVGGNRKKTM